MTEPTYTLSVTEDEATDLTAYIAICAAKGAPELASQRRKFASRIIVDVAEQKAMREIDG